MRTIDEPRHNQSRRALLKKTVYMAPVILTLKAVPAFASQGSGLTDDTSTQNDPSAAFTPGAPAFAGSRSPRRSSGGGGWFRWVFAVFR
jgi:hypothetical protein